MKESGGGGIVEYYVNINIIERGGDYNLSRVIVKVANK